MSCRSATRRSEDRSERSADAYAIRASLFDVDIDRKKRIDDSIDYFGDGGAGRIGNTRQDLVSPANP